MNKAEALLRKNFDEKYIDLMFKGYIEPEKYYADQNLFVEANLLPKNTSVLNSKDWYKDLVNRFNTSINRAN